MSTKVNGETRERLGQSAKRSTAVAGQAGRGATVAGRCLPGAAGQNVGIFSLPGFVADSGQICFSRDSLPRFFLHGNTQLPARACGRSRADLLSAQQTAALLPLFAYAKRLRVERAHWTGTANFFHCKECLAWNKI